MLKHSWLVGGRDDDHGSITEISHSRTDRRTAKSQVHARTRGGRQGALVSRGQR